MCDRPAEEVARELEKLRKINKSLMARVERDIDKQEGAFSLFQAATALESKVRERTSALEAAMTELERGNRELKLSKQAADAASRAKSQFLATMSHEIRTPMNGVLGMTELLAASDLTTSQRRNVETIQRSAQALLTLINDILDFSKVEAGRLDLDLADFDLEALVDDTVELLSGRARAKNLVVESSLDVTSTRLHGDANRLRQILTNLVGNAVKFTERGRITVRVTEEESSDVSRLLRFEVEDTGIGIDPVHLPKLFQSFTQADGSMARRYGGTGLGLAIVKQLCVLMGGESGVRSRLGEGSTFWFTARLTPAIDSTIRGSHPRSPTNIVTRDERVAGMHVLVAEDNAINREVVAGMLELLGCTFELAHDGQQACQALLEDDKAPLRRSFDVVLMDCQMPEMDGFDATREVRRRERERGGERRPIIALTANGLSGDRERCLEAGMDDFLSKPFLCEDLVTTLARWRKTPSATAAPIDVAPPAPSVRPSNEVLDERAIDRIRALQRPGRPDVLARIVTTFRATAPAEVRSLDAAFLAGDAKTAHRIAHTLKSSSASLGATQLSEIFAQIEQIARDKSAGEAQLTAARALLEALHHELTRVDDALARLVRAPSGAASHPPDTARLSENTVHG